MESSVNKVVYSCKYPYSYIPFEKHDEYKRAVNLSLYHFRLVTKVKNTQSGGGGGGGGVPSTEY